MNPKPPNIETQEWSVVSVDTASIQRYVFASNKLKENIGASFIIEELLYKELMIRAIREAANEHAPDLEGEWKSENAPLALAADPDRNAEIGYIGGGNAMVIFRLKEHAEEFVRLYSAEVLRYFPGIRMVFGRVDARRASDFQGQKFKSLREQLNQSQEDCKNRWYTPAVVFKPGIVEDCPSSGEGAEFRDQTDEDGPNGKRWISASTKAKLDASEQALDFVMAHYMDELAGTFALTNEIDQLGQARDKGYVAVVHADGNGIGSRFMEADSLTALRGLSVKVSDIADRVMRKLLGEVTAIVERDQSKEPEGAAPTFDLSKFKAARHTRESLKSFDDRPILPIRPILAAGDDITFVCEGRLGVHLAAKILEFFEQEKGGGEGITACAGVAICKTHYPFFKAYHLAEELIRKSKDRAKKNSNARSWLHFLAVPSGFNGDLEDVLEQQFTVGGRQLLSGPYPLGHDPGSYGQLIDLLEHYCLNQDEEKGWPRSKLMEMREAFRMDESSRKLFIEEAEARGLRFHVERLQDLYFQEENGEKHPTLIYDMIQLADFYPDILSRIKLQIVSES